MVEQQYFPAADRDDVVKECRQARAAVQNFYEKKLFIAGLYGEVRLKVLEAAPVLAVDALLATTGAEMLIADQKGNLKLPTIICAVKNETEEKEENATEDKEELDYILDAINAIRIQRGKQPLEKFPSKFPKFNGNGNGNRNRASNGARPKTYEWGAHEKQILQQVSTHAEGMLQKNQGEWIYAQCANEIVEKT